MVGNILTMVREQSRQQEQRYIDVFPGWKRGTVPQCPRVVAGKRCYEADGRKVPECICTRYGRRIFDHTRIWRTPEGYRVLTAELTHDVGRYQVFASPSIGEFLIPV